MMTFGSDFCPFSWLEEGKLADGRKTERIKGERSVTQFDYFRGSTFSTWDSPFLPPSLLGASIFNYILHYLPPINVM